MKPSILASIARKVVVSAAFILLAGFFLFPWAKDWGRTGSLVIFSNPKVYGDAAYEFAAYAPILWLIPAGALLAGVIALIPYKAGRGQWLRWLVIFLVGMVMLYPHAWITDSGGVRTLSNPALKNEWQGALYVPWNDNPALTEKLVDRHGDVLGGEPYPDHGYTVSLAADGVIIVCSLAGLVLENATKKE